MLVVFPKDVSKAHSGEWGAREKSFPHSKSITPLLCLFSMPNAPKMNLLLRNIKISVRIRLH
jgi:hypothetical protein